MTPKEKSIELVDKYYWTFGDGYLGEQHIQFALIAIDEVLQYSKAHGFIGLTEYYEEVKQELEKL
jgi:hypothetical protein